MQHVWWPCQETHRLQRACVPDDSSRVCALMQVAALEMEGERLKEALSQAQTQARAVPPDLVHTADSMI